MDSHKDVTVVSQRQKEEMEEILIGDLDSDEEWEEYISDLHEDLAEPEGNANDFRFQ